MLWWKAKLNAVTTKFAELATPETELSSSQISPASPPDHSHSQPK
jgi:hypothetical protein